MTRWLLPLLMCWPFTGAEAFELVPERVADNIYALIGEIGPRSVENHALNNTLGFIVTGKGVALVGSGASPSGARLIEAAVARITDQPIRWVINIGVQDHHWLGNDYFADKGVDIIALAKTVADQRRHAPAHLERLARVLPDEIDSILPRYSDTPIDGNSTLLNLGGIDMQLTWSGGGHYSGDAYLWLSAQRVVFAGDVIFHNRMLGIQNETQLLAQRQAFRRIAALQPLIVVPGHGHAGDLAQSRRDTGDYLDWLVNEVSQALKDWQEIGDTVNALAEAPAFRHLEFYDGWHRTNVNRAYLQLEAVQ